MSTALSTDTRVTSVDTRTTPVELLSHPMMKRLRQRQLSWARQPVSDRLRVIRRLRQELVSLQDQFCQALLADLHKPAGETIAAELLPVASACKFLEKRARSILRTRKVSWWDVPMWLMGEQDLITRKPRGIVGIIGTWNYPMFLNGVQLVHALAAGNAVIWKPSEVAPRTAEVMTTWLRRGGVADDLVHVLPPEREWGPRLAEADINYVVFTGHDTTGRKLAARLGDRLIPSTLELSGHDAMLLLPDADLDLTSRAIHFGVTVNTGQTCVASRRIYVPQQLMPALQEKLQTIFSKYPSQRPLAMANQQDHVTRLVKAAQGAGARILIPNTVELPSQAGTPVILTDVTPGMAISQEALFAPVAMLLPYEELKEAVAGIHESDYGLALSIFTENREEAKRLAQELPAGLVTINDIVAPVGHPATPFGGVGRSGWGVTQGAEGLLELTIPQVISYRTNKMRLHFDPPGTSPATDEAVLSSMFRWEHSPTFWQRTKAFFALLGAGRRAIMKKK